MVSPTASFTPGSPPPYTPLVLSFPLSFSSALSLCLSSLCWCYWQLLNAVGLTRQRKRIEVDRETVRGKKGDGEWRNERREEEQGENERYQSFPHLHRQCLTSAAVVRPPRDESITLNNVNVSPSQHKTNNHCSLPRPMSMASNRGSPALHSPLASLASTPLFPCSA